MSARDETIGFIGLGAMGRGMAANCVRKGFKLVVHDIRPEPVEALVELGATAAKDIADLARQCSIIITALPSGKEVTEIVMGPGGISIMPSPARWSWTCRPSSPRRRIGCMRKHAVAVSVR